MSNVGNSSDTEQAQELCRAALEAMASRGIPPTPENYEVWFAYTANWNPDLNLAIDAIIGNDAQFTEGLNQRLYQDYFGTDAQSRALDAASTKLQSELGRILERVLSVGESAGKFRVSLETYSGQTKKGMAAGELVQVIEGLARETQFMVSQSQKMETQFADSSRRIGELEEDLIIVQRQAMTDGLTGISNRKCFDLTLEKWAAKLENSDKKLSLLMADIDYFKKFNDAWGHQLGDQVLKLVAQSITQTVKGRDEVARYGGEEFAVLLPDTTLRQAEVVAEQIRELVSTRKLNKKSTGEPLGQITLSIGVAEFWPEESLERFVARADMALYKAKDHGRNRVIAAPLDRGALSDFSEAAQKRATAPLAKS